MKKFLSKLQNVRGQDIEHIFLFLLAIIPSVWVRRKRPKMWLICEYGEEARDNGYWFYKYVREAYPERDIVYAIKKSALDYQKIKPLGESVEYGSLKHWIYYLAADVNISSHKGGKPNAAVCYLLEVYGLLKNKRVFLQHGITKDMAELFFYENTRMRLFICGAQPEFDFVKKYFHYPEENVVYTGFARFDQLQKIEGKRQLLVVPTWRRWLYHSDSDPYSNTCREGITSEYYNKWYEFLSSDKLKRILENYGYQLVFFPHRNATSLFETMKIDCDNIRVVDWKKSDLQILMRESDCMITDYSSVAMDFSYMRKPLLYYQFDYDAYRQGHFAEGYFDYERDGFGKVVYCQEELLEQLEAILENQCKIEEQYLERVNHFFKYHDTNNCERIYREIVKI